MSLGRILTVILRHMQLPADVSVSGESQALWNWRLFLLAGSVMALEMMESVLEALQGQASFSQIYLSPEQWQQPELWMLCSYLLAVLISLLRPAWLPGLVWFSAVIVMAGWWLRFPSVANHYHLYFLLILGTCGSLALSSISAKEREYEEMVSSEKLCWDSVYVCRWSLALLMLWTGTNKVLYGTYFEGQYLASLVAYAERTREIFGWILSEQEMVQLSARGGSEGPFRFTSWQAIGLSNLVYLAEITAGALLLFPRSRSAGAIFTLLVLIGIELIAKELVFGALLVQLVLNFFPWHFQKWGKFLVLLLYLFCAVYLVLKMTGLVLDLGIT